MKHQCPASKNASTAMKPGLNKTTKADNKTLPTFDDKRQVTQLQNQQVGMIQQATQSSGTTGLPDNVKAGIESLSGYAMDDVKVHYNSSKPAQLNAHAYAQGSNIHIASGQEKHLAHEAWHVVQQKQGRVKPTVQMKTGLSINDDAGLEKEADVMGAKALAAFKPSKRTPQLKASNVTSSDDVVQNKLRIGNTYEFLGPEQELPGTLELSKAATAVLVKLKNSPLVYSFESQEELQELATAIGEVDGSAPLILRILDDPMFKSRFAQKQNWFFMRLGDWMIEQLNAVAETVNNPARDEEFAKIRQQITISLTPRSTLEQIVPAFRLLTRYQTSMFTLNENRAMAEDHGTGSIERQRYGYHLTKIHNLKGVKAMGLQPSEGAGKGGSLAMSTAEQKVGSQKTSAGMVAYGLHPETFRPYINQFEDRRQMIEGQSLALKPVMLRFLITDKVRRRAIELPKEGIYDYMDLTALNSDIPISPDLIEVLTPDGYVPIKNIDIARFGPALELRHEDDNSRMTDRWKGELAAFTYEQIPNAVKTALGINEEALPATPLEDINRLRKLRDGALVRDHNINYVFRGATFQTSGHRKTWEYVFSVAGAEIPDWLQKRILYYQTNFHELAQSLIGRLGQDYEDVGPAIITWPELAERFTRGASPGTNLNCLLYTVDQLRHNTQVLNEGRVATMREVLTEAGFTQLEGMIDFYGGAGMQLANDLGVRLQVYQRVGPDQFIEHPILGSDGPILNILHRGNHFAPLWPQ